ARQVTVEAVLLPDSLIYRTQTDSLGRFTLAPMPHGAYLLRGYADQNKNRRLDGRETWDTVAAAPAPSADAVLWIAERDTFPPRLQAVTPRDSQTVDVQLSQPFDPAQAIDTSNVRLRLLPDSTPVAVLSFLPRTLDDTLMARARALADSLRADSVRRARPDSGARPPVDSTKRPPPPPPPAVAGGTGRPGRAPAVDSALIALLATRPSLSDRLVLRVGAPLPPESKYVLEIDGIRNITGASGHALIGFAIPKRAPPPKARVDSLRPDSAAHDSTKAPGRRPQIHLRPRPATP
ncbi:MAG TPA: hypothetical protein VFI13_12425, partial [Gemmatimonadales bacterium]|nr:hypothetical protein [Gemmatimonadales bacterium]